MSDAQTRLTRLEEALAHQTRVIEELSEQVAAQWKAIDAGRAKLDRLAERFLSLEEQTQEAPANARPPHY